MEVPTALQALRSKCIACKYHGGSRLFEVVIVDMTQLGVRLVVADVYGEPGQYQDVLHVDLTEISTVELDSYDKHHMYASGPARYMNAKQRADMIAVMTVLNERRPCGGGWVEPILFAYCLSPIAYCLLPYLLLAFHGS